MHGAPQHPSEAERLFDVIPEPTVAVGMTPSNDSLVLRANHAFGQLVGVPPDALRDQPFCELLHPDHHVGAQSVLLRLVAGALDSYTGEVRLVGAYGGLLRVSLSARVVRAGLSEGPAVWVQVTKHRGSSPEAARLDVYEAQKLARLGSFRWLPEQNSVLISDEVFALFGLEPGSLPGTLAAWEPRLHKADLPQLLEEFTAAVMDPAARRFEFRFKPRNEPWRWAEGRLKAELVDGQPVRLFGTIQDIHERKLGEEHLLQELEELEAVTDLREALTDGRLSLHAQPIFEMQTREPRMAELLVRLTDASGKVVPAGEFLGLAERHGVIKEIDEWVLGQAVELAAAGSSLTVNISARTISDPSYTRNVIRLLRDCEVDPRSITFEITETALVENLAVAREFARQLESVGCRLALDDFGTGYGALTYLKEFPAHYLKIDREFVGDATVNPRSHAVIKGIVNLARTFGQQTIAEGVEDETTLELLAELEVDFAQGFHLARPWPIARGEQGRIPAQPPIEEAAV
jgi:EAL domain-containing protein (putative c-di-GMP-specific phosphodiesterase class I)/PAS domain-containing protein